MSRLALYFLGPPRIELDGQPVHIGRRKVLALLAFLAVTGTPHRRESLAALLCPEHDQSRALGYLRRVLSMLRGALGGGWLLVDREVAGVDPGADVWLDVERFRHLLSTCEHHRHPASEPCADCGRLLEEAADLYQDDFLAGFTLGASPGFDEWQRFETEGLRDELASVLERLARWKSSQGCLEPAIQQAKRRLALDPLHEPSHRMLMQLYVQAGQRAAALRQYRLCECVLRTELDLPPSGETTALVEQIRAGAAGQVGRPDPARRPGHDLPAQPTPFVGREAALVEIEALLQDPACRLLTLVGPGGSGKTRLALEAAARRLPDFPDGAFFVALAPLRSTESIVPTVAQLLGLSFSGERDPQQQLLAFLRQKHMLLLLDGLEHLLARPDGRQDDASELVGAILEAAPGVKVLVTSRVALRVQHEQLFPVGGMDYPERAVETEAGGFPPDVAGYSAIRLFVQSARRVAPGFELQAKTLAGVARICRLVDGLPLAIVLAAGWVRMLAPREIADHIEMGLDFLESDARDVPARHRSMRAVFDHSWRLLGERERGVLAALSVFRGGFTREAARTVAGASLRELRSLVDASLIQPTRGECYEMHELLRQYAQEQLSDSPRANEYAREWHTSYYVARLERWDRELRGPRQQEALANMEVEIENARTAWHWAADRAQVDRLGRAIGGLCWFYTWRSRHREMEADCGAAAACLERVVAATGPARTAVGASSEGVPAADTLRILARLLRWQGTATHAMRSKEKGRELVQHSLALLERPELADRDTRQERAFVLLEMASQARDTDLEESRRLAEQSLALYQALGDTWWTAHALMQLGLRAVDLDAYGEARQLLERSLALFRTLGDQREIAWLGLHLGSISLYQGQHDEAELLVRKALASHEEIGDRLFLAEGLIALAGTLCMSGRFTQAEALLDESAQVFDDLGDPYMQAYRQSLRGIFCVLLGQWEHADTQVQMGLRLCREAGFSTGVGVSLWTLCWLVLARGQRGLDAGLPPGLPEGGEARKAATEARRMAERSITLLREMRHRADLAVALAALSMAERWLGNREQAQQHMGEALRISAPTGSLEAVLFALPGTALLLADRGDREQAVEVYALASRYPFVANSAWFELMFGRHIAAVAGSLPAEVVTAAEARGRDRDLWATVEELVAELR